MFCEVLRPFEGAAGRIYQIGEEVDSSTWRNEQSLIDSRFLRPKGFRPPKKKEEEKPQVARVPVRKKNERALS